MERTFDQTEDMEDLGAASIETLGPPGNLPEFGVIGRGNGIEQE
jgi:hypothetical protein